MATKKSTTRSAGKTLMRKTTKRKPARKKK
jgi:hypothetical protein